MASTYLSRTPSSAGNQKTLTFSAWVKRSGLNDRQALISTTIDGSNETHIWFDTNDEIFVFQNTGTNDYALKTTAKFRDVSAWYHVVMAIDTTQATASNRIKLYINNVQQTSFTEETYPSLNFDTRWNNGTTPINIGRMNYNAEYYNGQMTHIHFIDGTAYDADTFGETDATTGIWKPKTEPSVTYGTNGFFLKGENSGAMGTDSSGNANNFTVNGTPTQTIDTPSNVFATGNPLAQLSVGTLSNGNNTITGSNTSNYYGFISSTLGMSSGKYYAEFKKISGTNGTDIGISDNPNSSGLNVYDYLGNAGVGVYQWSYDGDSGNVRNNGSSSAYGNSYTDGDIVGIALDLDNNKLYFSKNGTWQNSGDPTSGATGTGAISITVPTSTNTGIYHFAFGDNSGSSFGVISANFGNGFFGTTAVASAQNPDDGIGIFEYDVPTGYRALCTKSINAEEYS